MAVYLVGDAIFRLCIEAGVAWSRLLAAVLALAMAPVGTTLSAVAELAGIWLVLVGVIFALPVLAQRPGLRSARRARSRSSQLRESAR